MRTKWTVMAGLIVGLGWSGSATAVAGGFVNPFLEIVDRNPFSLRPPPVVEVEPVLPTQPVVPPAIVEVTGITSILAQPRALLEIVPGPGKPMLKPILGVGERMESIEVISIDVAKAEVVIRNGLLVTNVPLKVAKAGAPLPGPAATPDRGLSAGMGVAAGNGMITPGFNQPERRSVSLGGGVPVPERLTRVPRLPPAPQVNRPSSAE